MKRLVRDVIQPNKDLGHIDKHSAPKKEAESSKGFEKVEKDNDNDNQGTQDELLNGQACPNIN